MNKYIEKIKNQEPINLELFKKKCLKHNIKNNDIKKTFDIKGAKKNKYLLTIKNESNFDSIFSKFLKIHNDKKVQSALRGDSKTSKSERSLLIWKEHKNSINNIGIEFSKDSYELTIRKKKTLVIIENLNNFLNIESNFDNNINLDDCNFVWGAGNGITNSHFIPFLNEYENIICFFDIDLGGLKFFKSLNKKLNKQPLFLMTEFMKTNVIKYGKKIDIEQYKTLLDLYQDVKGLESVISFISTHKKFAEQEIFQQ